MYNPRIGTSSFPMSADAAAERVTAFLRKVYGWMSVGLAITALVALQVADSPAIVRSLVSNQFLFFGLILAELGLVFFLSARADRIAPGTATALSSRMPRSTASRSRSCSSLTQGSRWRAPSW